MYISTVVYIHTYKYRKAEYPCVRPLAFVLVQFAAMLYALKEARVNTPITAVIVVTPSQHLLKAA